MAVATARAKFVRMSPRKLRLVADLIRGRKVVEARDILSFNMKAAAPILQKVLASAVANADSLAAEREERIDTDEMLISNVQVNGGPTMRRFRAAPRGRATRIRKRSSHIELEISTNS